MSNVGNVGAELQAAQAALPEHILATAAEQLDSAERYYTIALEGTSGDFGVEILAELSRTRQALADASEALHIVSESTVQYLAALGLEGLISTDYPAKDTADELTGVRRDPTPEALPTFAELQGGPHTVSRTDINPKLHSIAREDYGVTDIHRVPVADNEVSWDVEVPGYDPPFVDMPRATSGSRKPDDRADPEDPAVITAFTSISGEPIRRDAHGRPLNPAGRTGMAGRGMLNKWGETPAADLIVTRYNPVTGELEAAAIQRQDTGEWSAVPGGKVGDGEDARQAALREFYEEAGGQGSTYEIAGDFDPDPWNIDISKATVVYVGYVDDSRNTDNAWMATTALHRHLNPEEASRIKLELRPSSDALGAKWVSVHSPFFASHGHLVSLAARMLSQREQ